MRTNQHYSQEFKEAMIKKLLNRGNQTIKEFCKANNIARSTVTTWQFNCAKTSEMKYKKNKSKYSAEDILKIIVETFSLNEEELGLYLRKNGLHSSQLNEWKSTFLTSMSKPKLNANKKDERDIKIKSLEKNLKKKMLP